MRGLADDLVVTPYASLIAIKWAPAAVEKNVHALMDLGCYGLYGFYEAIDFTSDHLKSGKRSAIVSEYMSHHQGMILMSVDNYLNNDIMVQRVHADVRIQSVELLLQEQVPAGITFQYPGEEKTKVSRWLGKSALEIPPWSVPVPTAHPHMHLLSNGDFSVLLSNHGGGFCRWKDTALTRWQADGTRDTWGTWIYIQDLKNKTP
jgi:cyclic beta-1,2-glucan synthetase